MIKEEALENNKNAKEKVKEIREEMENQKDYSLPSIIYGDHPPPLKISSKNSFQGIPVSPGSYKGKIKVVRGSKDFHKVVDGCILVIPFSDVGWTPILLRAGAIVSESGGMLSHASIVAREMSIPAISSADHACSLEDDLEATIDGYNGLLIIED